MNTSAKQWLTDPVILLAAYAATTFLSALLLFSIQPMFAKMVLPVLGGSSSVWAVAIFFFQAALLAGYCYAHLLIARTRLSITGPIHLGLCLLALVSLPIGLPVGWSEPPPAAPYFWQLGLFAVAIGLPFLAVSANAPLLQAWFARTGHPHASDPYFLYAASNLGSLIALMGYPFVLEPALGLSALSRAWTNGFVLLLVALTVVFVLARSRNTGVAGTRWQVPAGSVASSDGDVVSPTWLDRLVWVGLAFVPAALLTAFSTHVTTDIASAPLLWVLPLSLYLLTFVLVFRERPVIGRELLLAMHLLAVACVMLALSQTLFEDWFVTASTGVVAFFTSAMVAHRMLYEARPKVSYLTEFYLWMSFGGALGGLAAALIAPRIFNEVFEYPLLIALSMACRPGVFNVAALNRVGLSLRLSGDQSGSPTSDLSPEDWQNTRALLLIVLGSIAAFIIASWKQWTLNVDGREWSATFIITLLLSILLIGLRRRPTRQLATVLMMCGAIIILPSAVKQGDAQRSYFGIYRVQALPDAAFRTFMHGTTLHGAQRIRDKDGNPVEDTTPATYYYPKSPMAQTIAIVQKQLGRTKGRYGVVGLGAGSLACYAKLGESWRFYEIDPLVVRIASDVKLFTFLAKCQPNTDIVIGDARLTLAKEPDGSFDLIIVDAFSSDAVPVHLMTKEAMKLYLDKVKPDGVVLMHISNLNLDLAAVFGATLRLIPGVHGVIISDDEANDEDEAEAESTVAIYARSQKALEPLRSLKGVSEPKEQGLRGWTDDYSDILSPFLRKLATD